MATPEEHKKELELDKKALEEKTARFKLEDEEYVKEQKRLEAIQLHLDKEQKVEPWSATVLYPVGVKVLFEKNRYVSQGSNNFDRKPSEHPSYWTKV